MVGDYKWDALCAKTAGVPCALLLEPEQRPEWARGVKYVIHRLTELIAIIEKEAR